MDTLHHFIFDAIRAMAAVDNLGGQIIATARGTLPRSEADSIAAAVWGIKAVLARAHADDPLGRINDLDERLQAAQEQK